MILLRSMPLESKSVPVCVPQMAFLEPRDSVQTMADMPVRRVHPSHTCQWHCFSPPLPLQLGIVTISGPLCPPTPSCLWFLHEVAGTRVVAVEINKRQLPL